MWVKNQAGGKRPEGIASFLSCQSNSLSRHTDGPGVLPKAHHPLFAPVTMVTWEQQPPSEHRWPFSVKVTGCRGQATQLCPTPHEVRKEQGPCCLWHYLVSSFLSFFNDKLIFQAQGVEIYFVSSVRVALQFCFLLLN